ncbi:MAG TPA: hypothetical protein DEP84_02175 [Chloroflexi bacterium]|nr:hypothetical protein [Chloroflexota bacterium]
MPNLLAYWPAADGSLRRLKRITIAGPLLFIGLLEFVRHQLLAADVAAPVALMLVGAVLVTGSWLFAEWVFGLIADLQARLETALAEAQRERARLLAVLDASADGIYVVEPGEQISLVNRTLERLLGLPREKMIGQTCFGHTLTRTRDGRLLCESACPFQEPTRHRYPTEITAQTANGLRSLEIASGRILGLDGQVEGVVHVLRDLTARKEIERLQDEFISLVSHELKTPLNHIKGFASTLLQEDVEWDRETERDFLETIDQEADRLTHLVENILEMARLANAQEGAFLELDWHAPADMISAVIERMRAFVDDHHFVLEMPASLPPLRCDRRTVELLLNNLLDNAVKYSPSGTTVTVRACSEAETLKVVVIDEGAGIPAHVLPRVFERFYRGANRQRAPGTGLGLAICRRVAEAHCGTLTAASAPAAGSTFTLMLPLEGPNDEQAPRFGG